jgi:hypothetical protein
LPLAPGKEITAVTPVVIMAEPAKSPGIGTRRDFPPTISIFKEASGPERAINRTFRNLRPNAQGKLVISLVPVDHYACVNAIEVIDEVH